MREFCCKSGNFATCYQSQGKVREFHLWSLPMHIFHRLANDIWTRTKSWIMSSFKYHSSNYYCSILYLFSCLHNVRHKISTICMMLKTFSCADLFSRPLCWSIYWWIKCDFYVVLNILQNHHGVYITTVTGICVGSQGKVREFFSANPVATLNRQP